MEYKCPDCNKSFTTERNLNRHKARMHAAHLNDDKEPVPVPSEAPLVAAQAQKPQELKVVTKAPSERQAGYHCIACGGSLVKGQTPCPSCGAALDWEALNA